MNYKKIAIASVGVISMLSVSTSAFAADAMTKSPQTKTNMTTTKPIKKVAPVKKVAPKIKMVKKPN